jgi:HD-GYP domain-containing protein (c-di-GMP phosphodiesterase class II)
MRPSAPASAAALWVLLFAAAPGPWAQQAAAPRAAAGSVALFPPIQPAWGQAFKNFNLWLDSPAGLPALSASPSLLQMKIVPQEQADAAFAPLVERLPAEARRRLEGISSLSEAEQKELVSAVAAAREISAPVVEARVAQALREAEPVTDASALAGLASQVQALSFYGEGVRESYRSLSRRIDALSLRKAERSAQALLEGVRKEEGAESASKDGRRTLSPASLSVPEKASPDKAPVQDGYEELFLSFFGLNEENPKTALPVLKPSDSRAWGLENIPDGRYAEILKKAEEAFVERDPKDAGRLQGPRSLDGLYGRIWGFDQPLYYHMVRVGLMAANLALAMGLPRAYAEDLSQAARLHDVGKLDPAVHAVISKPGKLTPEERALMEAHPEKGAESLALERGRPERMWRMAAKIVLHHHEAFDGSGYPDKLRGNAIPLEARITAVADVFDALMENRPYRPGMRQDEALAVMERERERFDPEVYRAFLKVVRR